MNGFLNDRWNWSDEHRHKCEVRYCLMLRKFGKKPVTDYLNSVLDTRGNDAYQKLNKDCQTQWGKGNRGQKGDWRD